MFVGDHNFEIVSKSLTGAREVDEQTHTSLAVLAERLESLRKTNRMFAGVSFSRDVERLSSQRVAVG